MDRIVKPTKELEVDDSIEISRIILSQQPETEEFTDQSCLQKCDGSPLDPPPINDSSSIHLVIEKSTITESSTADLPINKCSTNESSSTNSSTEKSSMIENDSLFGTVDEGNFHSTSYAPVGSGGINDFSGGSSRFDKKQIFNILYFALGAAGVATTAYAYEAFPLHTLTGIFGLIALVAALCSVRQKTFATTPEVYLSKRTRNLVRTVALLLPIPFVVTAVSWCATYQLLVMADEAFTAGKYDTSLTDLRYAELTNLPSPLTESIATRRAATCWQLQDTPKALHYANIAVALDPNDGYAWSTKAAAMLSQLQIGDDIHYLEPLKPNSELAFNETIIAANNAVRLDPGNGENFRVSAYVNAHEGLLDQALADARQHAKMHSEEAGAHQLNAEVLERMGRYNEALKEANMSIAMVGHRDGSDPAYRYRDELLNKMAQAEQAQKDFEFAAVTSPAPSPVQPVATGE